MTPVSMVMTLVLVVINTMVMLLFMHANLVVAAQRIRASTTDKYAQDQVIICIIITCVLIGLWCTNNEIIRVVCARIGD